MFDPYRLSTKHRPPDQTGKHWKRPDKHNPEILAWRRKMKKFRQLRAQVLGRLAETGWSDADIHYWLSTPKAGLQNRTPLSMLKPRGVTTVLRYAQKYLPKKS